MTAPASEIAELRRELAERAAQGAGKTFTVQERRAMLEAAIRAKPLPPGLRFEASNWGGVACEDVAPAGAREGRTILYLHGGGYTIGSPSAYRPLAGLLAQEAQAQAVVVDYRLGPEHPYPAAAEDAEAAYLALIGTRDPRGVVVAGDSAGGGLALTLALRLKARGAAQPAGYCIFSPWADFTQSSPTYQTRAAADPLVSKERLDAAARAYLAGHDPRDPLASPLFGDFSNVAPMLIQVGSDEVLLGEAAAVAQSAGAAGVAVRLEIWPQMLHVWHSFADRLEPGRRAIAVAGAWVGGTLAEAERK
jgi:acetyl esterase/lipase